MAPTQTPPAVLQRNPSAIAPSYPSQALSAGSNDFLLSIPAPVLHLLARTSAYLRCATGLTQALSWSHPNRWISALTLVMFWLLCLYSHLCLRYGLNAGCMLLLAYGYVNRKKLKDNMVAMDNDKLVRILDDARQLSNALRDLHARMQPIIDLIYWRNPSASKAAFIMLCTSYPVYLSVTYLYGPRPIIMLLGTLALSWNCALVRIFRVNLRRSFVFRWITDLLFGIFFKGTVGVGQLLQRSRRAKDIWTTPDDPSKAPMSIEVAMPTPFMKLSSDDLSPNDNEVVFTFTIYQNERWWIGLDWTQALLPHERPAWCDSANQPIDPPSTFQLPAPSITTISSPTKAQPHAIIERTVKWEWLDATWVVKPDSDRPTFIDANPADTVDLSKVSSPPPTATATVAEWARGKAASAAQATRDQSKRASLQLTIDDSEDEALHKLPSGAGMQEDGKWTVDSHGWQACAQYGDNAWEKMGAKTGLGKYTRRRAWIRRARVLEISNITTNDSTLRKRI